MLKWLAEVADYGMMGGAHTVGVLPTGLNDSGTLFETMGQRITIGKNAPLNKKSLGKFGAIGAAGAAVGWYTGMGPVEGAVSAMTLAAIMRPGQLLHGETIGKVAPKHFLLPGLGIAASAFFAYQGYQEKGVEGVRDAVVWDLAVNAATAKFGYKTIHPEIGIGATKGAIVNKGMFGTGLRMVGASAGASVGQALGSMTGIPGASIAGAFAGGYIGAAPISFMKAHPVLGATGLAAGAMVAGTAAVGYGTYQVLKMGYAHQQARKGIQTSGSLAAFMTAGAHTMRSRAVQAIHKSHMNARSALGHEAQFMHYPSKNYFSPYRQ